MVEESNEHLGELGCQYILTSDNLQSVRITDICSKRNLELLILWLLQQPKAQTVMPKASPTRQYNMFSDSAQFFAYSGQHLRWRCSSAGLRKFLKPRMLQRRILGSGY